MFRVLYGIRDKEVAASSKNSTSAMLSNPNHSEKNGEGNGQDQNETFSHVKRGGPDHAGMHKNAALRFPGFSKQDKQIEEEDKDAVWIILNVGGCIYSTTRDTLLKVKKSLVAFKAG